MAMDSVRKIYEHLVLAEPKTWGNIDLFLYSNGGDGTVPWRLVTLLREKAQWLTVLVPFRAFSAATLTALGADSVVMHEMGILGPTDPTVTNAFNPPDPLNAHQRIGISVEDVTAYISLIREDANIRHEDELIQAINKLADHVHPLALGNVKRSLSQSRMMAKKLLSLHMDTNREEHRIQEIVDNFTSKLFYHGHPINRSEAKEYVGLSTVEAPSPRVEELMWSLYKDYESEMNMEEPFNTVFDYINEFPTMTDGATSETGLKTAKLAYIESENRSDLLSLDYVLSGVKEKGGAYQVQFLPRRRSWTKE